MQYKLQVKNFQHLVKINKGDLMKRILLRKLMTMFVLCIVFIVPEIIHASILKPGTPAPSFSMPSLAGKRESLKIWCGKVLSKPYVNDVPHTVIVSFWATYCKPCHKEIPELEKFYKKHKNEKIKIFLISIDDKGAGIVVPFAKERGYKLPILFDPYQKTAGRYGVKSLPALFVIGPGGIIRYSSVGYKKDVSIEGVLEKVLKAIKEGKSVSLDRSAEKGETVSIREKKLDKSTQKISPRQKWHAVARIECGISAETVAAELNVSKEELRKWYNDLKKRALELWE